MFVQSSDTMTNFESQSILLSYSLTAKDLMYMCCTMSTLMEKETIQKIQVAIKYLLKYTYTIFHIVISIHTSTICE